MESAYKEEEEEEEEVVAQKNIRCSMMGKRWRVQTARGVRALKMKEVIKRLLGPP